MHMIVPAAMVLLVASCSATPPGYREWSAPIEPGQHGFESPGDAADQVPDPGVAEGLGDLIDYALLHNPGIMAAFERWRAGVERVPQAVKLPEPRLSLGWYLSEVETRAGPMQAAVGLVQPLPWFGELDLAGQVAWEEALLAQEELEAARLELVQRIRDSWYEYAWLEDAIAITRGHGELLAHWESVALARFETGLGAHADVIRTQVELGKLEDRARTLEDLRRPIAARLNAALDRPPAAALPPPADSIREPAPPDGERLAAGLDSTSPMLRALAHRIEAARHGIELAETDFRPDFAIGASYTAIGEARSSGVSGSGDDALALTLGLELPIWRSAYRAGVREATARMIGARKTLDETRNRLVADLEMVLYRYRDADRRVDLFRDTLIPKGEESVAALDTAYQSGEQGFLDLIDAERLLLEFQLEEARAETDRAQALAEAERITGQRLLEGH